mmetsp:Transcript_24152/g.39116  ORF Transcript_24152/g.39116 Transcript_24152/m.39116 type:complete len:137 (-) Transcript_24152:220-630(-)
MKLFLAVAISFLVAVSLEITCIVATEKYYNCDVYTNAENATSNHTLCVEDFQDGKFYCKSWECDTPDCPTDQQTTQSDCPICPDTCSDGGRILEVGEQVLCVDGSNICQCVATGVVISTRKATTKELLCTASLSEN